MRSFSTSAASFSHFSSRVWGISPSIGRPTTEAPLEWASAVTSSNRSVSVAELRMSGVPAAACTAWAITAGSAVSIMMPQEECSRMSATHPEHRRELLPSADRRVDVEIFRARVRLRLNQADHRRLVVRPKTPPWFWGSSC